MTAMRTWITSTRWAVFLTSIWCLLAAGAAAAEPERTAVVALDVDPKLPEYLRAKARGQIEHGLASTGYTVVPGSEVEKLPRSLAACREGACLPRVGAILHAAMLVIATISGKDESTIVELRIFDGATADLIATVREVCDLCGIAELEERVSIAASLLRSRVEVVHARREADAEQARRFEVARRVANPVTAHETRRVLSIPGVSVAAIGSVAAGVGVYLLAIDGRGTCEPGDQSEFPDPGAVIRYPDPSDRSVYLCKNRYDTKLTGTITLSAGVAALALGAVLIVRGDTERVVVVSPAPGGATVGVRGAW